MCSIFAAGPSERSKFCAMSQVSVNITTPLPPTQFELSIDTESVVREVAADQPIWIRALILQTLASNIFPLSDRQLRELIEFLCPADLPAPSPQVQWASRKIMQERLRIFTNGQRRSRQSRRLDSGTLRALGFKRGRMTEQSNVRSQREVKTMSERLRRCLLRST